MPRLATEKASKNEADQRVDQDIGARVRRLRKIRGLSLVDVSNRAGLSSGFLSQIERGISSASIRAVARIADALDVALGDLFQSSVNEQDSRFSVSRAETRKVVEFPELSAAKELLTPFPFSPRLDMYILTMQPGGSSGKEPFSHKGIEAGYVLEGGFELIVDGRKEILSAGDSFRFESTKPHQYSNAGSVVARAIWINYHND